MKPAPDSGRQQTRQAPSAQAAAPATTMASGAATMQRLRHHARPVVRATSAALLTAWAGCAMAMGVMLSPADPAPVHATPTEPTQAAQPPSRADRQAKAAADAPRMATIGWRQLPQKARDTYALILQGGPFPYDKDGSVFGNRERLLPVQARGYYREYTVPTPGVRHRGARRIVCGGRQATAPEHCYYTADHYASFRRMLLP